jgi:hypothetical protein
MAGDDLAGYRDNVVPLDRKFGGKGPPGPPLQPPSGGGTFDGMEARIARLESDVGHIRDDLVDLKNDGRDLRKSVAEIKVGMATLTERVNNLPTKGFIVTTVLTTLAVIAALIVFQGNLQQLFRAAPSAPIAASPH